MIKLLSGSIFDELVTAAIELNARTVVVGAIGHGLARRLLVGSVAERTAETSPIPILVVRLGTRLASWLRGEHPLKILVGYDFSAASNAALRWVNKMQKIGPCDIGVLHIDWPSDKAERLGYHGRLPLTKNLGETQNFLERHLREHVAMHLPPEQVTLTVEPGWRHPEVNLFETTQREKADLIVVGTHRGHGWGRLRFGSVSRNMLRHAGNNAVSYGCAILQRGGSLKPVHVLEPSRSAGNQPRPDRDNPKLRVQLRALVLPEAADRFEIETEIVENGDAAEAIRQAAERFNADAICLGSHRRSGLAKTFLGSVAQGVTADSRRPVLIVREEAS